MAVHKYVKFLKLKVCTFAKELWNAVSNLEAFPADSQNITREC